MSQSLPYLRKPTYLSPTALLSLERDPLLFYLHRCGPQESAPAREEQSLPMVVGSLFDAFVKTELAKTVGCPCPSLEELMGQVSNEALIPEGSKVAHELLRVYRKSGAFQALVDEGLAEVNLDPDRSVVPGTTRRLVGREVGGVPLGGYPDALIVRPDSTRVVLDWKTTSKVSPDPGWTKKFDPQDFASRYAPPHPKASEPFEELHPEWATQLVTYSWLLRPGVGLGTRFAPLHVAVDQVVYGSKDIRIYQYRSTISSKFQEELRGRYQAAWERLQTETLVDTEVAAQLAAVPEHLRGCV